jgi:hypothetical protein
LEVSGAVSDPSIGCVPIWDRDELKCVSETRTHLGNIFKPCHRERAFDAKGLRNGPPHGACFQAIDVCVHIDDAIAELWQLSRFSSEVKAEPIVWVFVKRSGGVRKPQHGVRG